MTIHEIGSIRPGLSRGPGFTETPRHEAKRRPRTPEPLSETGLVLFVLGPFAFSYFLSYVFRTINALMAAPLARDLHVTPSDLGLLTSMYFLATTLVQLPIGALLDRYGPRRVQAPFLLVAALGALIFASADGLAALIVGRLLIGVGIATALMAGLKAAVVWFPAERITFANGLIVMTGALGAVAATVPADLLLSAIGWRQIFVLLAALCVLSAALIFVVVPGRPRQSHPAASMATAGLLAIYGDPRFLRLAPLSAAVVGTAWSLQGLWMAPWLTDVEHLGRETVVGYLLVMGLALAAGALALGSCAEWAQRRGITREHVLTSLALLFILAQLALIARTPVPIAVSLIMIAIAGAATVLSYAIMPGYFPKEISGRANGALNVLHMFGAFLIQSATGALVSLWPQIDSRPPVEAYQATFGIAVVLQAVALAWFLWPRRPSRNVTFASSVVEREEPDRKRVVASPYESALREWAGRVAEVRTRRAFWRTAGLSSAALVMLLAVQVTLVLSRPVVPYVLNVSDSGDARIGFKPAKHLPFVLWQSFTYVSDGFEAASEFLFEHAQVDIVIVAIQDFERTGNQSVD